MAICKDTTTLCAVLCCDIVPPPSFLLQLTGIGVDELVKRGLLDKCKQGPLYWLDTADSAPCIGTGGIAAWQLTAHGKNREGGKSAAMCFLCVPVSRHQALCTCSASTPTRLCPYSCLVLPLSLFCC